MYLRLKNNHFKKAICLFAVTVLIIGTFTGCGSKEVELNADNVTDYFQFNLTYDNFDSHTSLGLPFAFSDVILEVYPTNSGELSNVNIKAEITCPDLWTFTSSGTSNADGTSSTIEVDIVMPADGKYISTSRIGRVNYSVKPDSPCTIKIIDASGTFTKN